MADEPLGLRQLMETDEVVVKHFGPGPNYEVSTPAHGLILTIKGLLWTLVLVAEDANKQEVLILRRPACSLMWAMEVIVGQNPPVVIRQKRGFSRFSPLVWIDDEHLEDHVLDIRPTTPRITFRRTVEYSILDIDDIEVGTMTREWSSEYTVNFPPDLDVRYKAGLVAACLILEQMRDKDKRKTELWKHSSNSTWSGERCNSPPIEKSETGRQKY